MKKKKDVKVTAHPKPTRLTYPKFLLGFTWYPTHSFCHFYSSYSNKILKQQIYDNYNLFHKERIPYQHYAAKWLSICIKWLFRSQTSSATYSFSLQYPSCAVQSISVLESTSFSIVFLKLHLTKEDIIYQNIKIQGTKQCELD